MREKPRGFRASGCRARSRWARAAPEAAAGGGARRVLRLSGRRRRRRRRRRRAAARCVRPRFDRDDASARHPAVAARLRRRRRLGGGGDAAVGGHEPNRLARARAVGAANVDRERLGLQGAPDGPPPTTTRRPSRRRRTPRRSRPRVRPRLLRVPRGPRAGVGAPRAGFAYVDDAEIVDCRRSLSRERRRRAEETRSSEVTVE